MYNRILLLCFGLIAYISSEAQSFQFRPDEKSIKTPSEILANNLSKPNNSYSDTLALTEEVKWSYLKANPSTYTNQFTYKSVQDFVYIGINHDTSLVIDTQYVYDVYFDIICHKFSDTNNPDIKSNKVLRISYHPDSLQQYTDLAAYKFSGYHAIQVVIRDVKDVRYGTTVNRNKLPWNFYIESVVQVQRIDKDATVYFHRKCTPIDNGQNLYIQWTPTYSNPGTPCTLGSDEIKPIEYELEWTYTDDYQYDLSDGSISYAFDTYNVSYDFIKNSSRVRVKDTSYIIPLQYEHGAIMYRIRAIRPKDINFQDIKYHTWTLSDQGSMASGGTCFESYGYLISTPHSNDSLNWQYSINFADDGKYKHVINYFDGSLRSRQTQTKINTDRNFTIIADQVYDYEGRKSIQTLPVPVQQPYLQYRNDIAINQLTSNPYKAVDFDYSSCSFPDSIPPLSSSSQANIYYSSLNPDKSGMQKFVPDAKGYPFTQTIYSPDNLVLWQSGAGLEHQLWTKHATRHEYARATPVELNKYFGTQVGGYEFYPKQITSDPNGQTSFTIYNKSGQVIITGLNGIPDTSKVPIDILPNYDTGAAECYDVLQNMTQEKIPDGIAANSTFYAEKNGTHSLQYRVSIPAFFTGCNDGQSNKYLWAKGYYSYEASDDCGDDVLSNITGIVGYDSVVTSPTPAYDTSSATPAFLNKGKYLTTKKLTFNRQEIKQQIAGFVKDNEPLCYKDEPTFIKESVYATQFPCVDSTTPDTFCSKKKRQMMDELYPGGKYGWYPVDGNGGFDYYFLPDFDWLQDASRDTFLPSIFGHESVTQHKVRIYQIGNGILLPDTVVFEGRKYYQLSNLDIDTFIKIFNDEIAEALLPLHPEYCKLKFCIGENKDALSEFANELIRTVTYKQAEQKNLFHIDSIIAQDPIYYTNTLFVDNKYVSREQIQVYLKYFTNVRDKSIDRIAIENAYCLGTNSEQIEHCKRELYKYEIDNFIFIDSNIKQLYFDFLKAYYIGNRSILLELLRDNPGDNFCMSCTPNPLMDGVTGYYPYGCPGSKGLADSAGYFQTEVSSCMCNRLHYARLDLYGETVFQDRPSVFDSLGHLSSELDCPQWMKDLINKANDPNYNPNDFMNPPTALLDSINVYKNRMCESKVNYIVDRLENCTLNQSILDQIRDSLMLQCSGSNGIDSLSISRIIATITQAGLALNDLCHPFTFSNNVFDTEPNLEYPYECGGQERYTGLSSFINRTKVVSALMNASLSGSTPDTFSLDEDNGYENSIADYLSITNNGWVFVQGKVDTFWIVNGYYSYNTSYYQFNPTDTTVNELIKLKIYATGGDTLEIFFSGKDSTSPALNTATTSIDVDAASCINGDISAINNGYITRSSSLLSITIDGTISNRKYYLWSNGVVLMSEKSNEKIDGCITCIGIKEAIEDFKNDKPTYGYDDAINHPLFENTLTNYLNNRFNRRFTYNDYLNLMTGCALSDQLEVNSHYATIKAVFSSDANANGFIANVIGYTGRDIIAHRIKYISSGNTHIGIDLNGVPFDSLLIYKNKIDTFISNNSGTSTYLPNEPLMVLNKTSCSPSTSLSGYSTNHSVDLYINGGTQQYTLYEFPVSYSTEEDHGDIISNAYSYSDQCPGAMVITDAALLRSKDYNSTEKQDYLTYVYGLTGNSEHEILDSISTSNLKQRITSYSGKELSYKDPHCSKGKRDLYVVDLGQSTNFGFGMLIDTILDGVTGSGPLFPTSLSTNISADLKVYHKANDVYWYRYFDVNNKMWNVHIQPPKNPHLELNTFILDSVKIGPGEDSIYRFTAYGHFSALSSEVVECAGYTDFPLGYGKRVANVVLYDEPGLDFCLDSLDCEYFRLQDAIYAGKIRYIQYFDSTVASMTGRMVDTLLKATKDSLLLCTQGQKNQIMLYYYDLTGNLTRTVPPAGVDQSGSANHTKVSVYEYNARGQLIKQNTPDGGMVEYFYDAAGKQIFSQNGKQRPQSKYSYNLYDKQDRIIETGEVRLGCSAYDANPQNDTQCVYAINGLQYTTSHPSYVAFSHYNSVYPSDTIVKYIQSKTRYDVIVTTYDTMALDLGAVSNQHLSTQEHLRSRVSSIQSFKVKSPNQFNTKPLVASHFSYDIAGNVKTVTHFFDVLAHVGQQYKRVDYDYDQLSGKINMISYNRNRPDQFYQKYSYDADNRITDVKTSRDGIIWNHDARYEYYKHGPLASLKIGDKRVQSLEYAYTIQGWLKAINGDVLRYDKDMGLNGQPGDLSYARDIMAHSISYFANDYEPIGTTAVTNLPEPDKGLYNGNIAALSTSVAKLYSADSGLHINYRYDQVQRLKLATYRRIDNRSTLSLSSPSNIYRSSYSYDGDGNFNKVNRYDGSAGKIDSLTYKYSTAKPNQLHWIEDAWANPAVGYPSGDSKQEMYYDTIGNLVRFYADKFDYDIYGKVVSKIDTHSKVNNYFKYNGSGTLVQWDRITKNTNGEDIHNTEFYIPDATGNTLAVLKTKSRYKRFYLYYAINNDIRTKPTFPVFVKDLAAVKATFKPAMVAYAITGIPTWVDSEIDRPISFYLDNSGDMYNLLLYTDDGYFNDMQSYQSSIISNSLDLANEGTNAMLNEILQHENEGKLMLQYFDTRMDATDLDNMWTYFSLTRDEYDHTQNAIDLYNTISSPEDRQSVVSEMIQVMNSDDMNNAGNGNRSFYDDAVNDAAIFQSTNLRYQGSSVVQAVADALYMHGDRGQMNNFFDQWGGSDTWLDGHVSTEDQLGIVMDADALGTIESFLNTAADTAISYVMAEMEDLNCFEYYDLAIGDATIGQDVAAAVSNYYWGVAEDTTWLAEHHLYGSNRLGIQTYDDTTARVTYDVDSNTTPINTLGSDAVWYSDSYGDLIKKDKRVPYGNHDVGEVYASRRLGLRYYEMTDHLGNVLASIMDRRTAFVPNGYDTAAYYHADIYAAQQHYPFGMMMDDRYVRYKAPSYISGFKDDYRYGFNGQQKMFDGYHDAVNFSFRRYNAFIGRFTAIDPLAKQYPWNSPYAFAENRVIDGLDLEGAEHMNANFYMSNQNGKLKIELKNVYTLKYLGENGFGVNSNFFDKETGTEIKELRTFTKTPTQTFYSKRDGPLYFRGIKLLPAYNSMDGREGFKKLPGVATATVGVILSGGTMLYAESSVAIGAGVVGILSSIDDFTIDGDGTTFAGRLSGSQDGVDKVKLLIDVTSLGGGLRSLIESAGKKGKIGEFATEFLNTVNDEVQSINGLQEQVEKNSNNETE